MPPPKSKIERVKEAVEILKQLKEVGIGNTEPGYTLTKEYLDQWIADGEPRTAKIPFVRFGRVGHMMLPRIEGRPATYVLKVDEETKEEFARKERARRMLGSANPEEDT